MWLGRCVGIAGGRLASRPCGGWDVGGRERAADGRASLEAEVAALVGEVAGDCGYCDYGNKQKDVQWV